MGIRLWNHINVEKRAKDFSCIRDWSKECSGSYGYAKRHKLVNHFSKHMKKPEPHNKLSLPDCIKSAKPYKTIGSWRKACGGHYGEAWTNGWLPECCSHMNLKEKKPCGFWKDKKTVENYIKKVATRQDLQMKYPACYDKAVKLFPDLLDKHLPKVAYSGTSTGEVTTRLFLEKVFKSKFSNVRPKWLINPKTGQRLELDGFSEKLKLAFEYGDHSQMSLITNIKERFIRDQIKEELCQRIGIKLIQLKIDSMKEYNSEDHLKCQIERELTRLNIKITKSFYSTKVVIKSPSGLKWNSPKIWECVFKCEKVSDFTKKFSGAHKGSIRLGIFSEIQDYFKRKDPDFGIKFTKSMCLKKAQMFQRSKDWETGHYRSFRIARENGWLSYCQTRAFKINNKKERSLC